VDRVLGEKISLPGLCRTLGVRMRWLLDLMVARFAAVPDHFHVQPVASSPEGRLGGREVEADELWSVVQKKTTPRGLWLAMDKQTRQSLAFHVGNRSQDSAKQLWANLRAWEREQATCYTDWYAAYPGVLAPAQPKAIAMPARKPNYLARCPPTLRQPLARLVRRTRAFAKTGANPLGAIRYFLCHYFSFAQHDLDHTATGQRRLGPTLLPLAAPHR
jgi:IS1 family transposase